MKTIFWLLLIFVFSFLFFEAVPSYVKESANCDTASVPTATIKLGLPWKVAPCRYQGYIWDQSLWERLTAKKDEPLPSAEINILLNNGCIKIFDGCNNCTVTNQKLTCTKKACQAYQEVKCLEYQIKLHDN